MIRNISYVDANTGAESRESQERNLRKWAKAEAYAWDRYDSV